MQVCESTGKKQQQKGSNEYWFIYYCFYNGPGLLLATLLSDANVYTQRTSSAIAQIRNTNITQLTSNKPPIISVADSNQIVQEGTGECFLGW